MTINPTASHTVDAPADAVWAVLDDFAAIDGWSEGIKKSYTPGSAAVTGLDAERVCELDTSGKKVLEERIVDYVEDERMTIDVFATKGVPVKSSITTFGLVDNGDGTTRVTIDASAEPRFPSLVAKIVGPLLQKGFSKGLAGLIDELETAAKAKAPA